MKRYREYKQVDLPWLKEIPSHWNFVRNKNVFTEKSDIVGQNSSDYVLLSLTKQGIVPRDMEGGGKFPQSFDSYKKVTPNQIVLCLFDIDETPRTVGISEYYGMITGAYTIMNVHEVIPKYIYYYYLSLDDVKALKPLYTGLRKTINIATFLSSKLPIPPKEEQNQIANYLDWKINEIDRLIEKEKILFVFFEKFFESKCESLIKHVILDLKLKFKLRHLARFQNGISESGDFFTDGFPFVSYSDVYNNTTLPSEVKGKAKSTEVQQRMYSVNKGDIFVTRTSETIDDAIFFSLCEKTIPNSVFSGFLIRIRPTKSFVLSKYLLYYLKTTFVRTQILKNLNLVTRVSVGQSLLKDIEIKIPDKEVQEYVIQIIDEMSNKIEEVKKRINEKVLCLQKLKQSLISEVVTGKIDVRNIEIPTYEKVDMINTESDDIENEEE